MKSIHNKLLVIIPILIIMIFYGCKTTPPPNLEIYEVQWIEYKNETLGISFEYPDAYHLKSDDGENLFFRYDGGVAFVVHHINEKQGDKWGLWVEHDPVGELKLNGRAWKKYIYNHQDAFFYVRTLSCVIPYKGKYLGFEFRTEGELDEVHEYILNSLVIL